MYTALPLSQQGGVDYHDLTSDQQERADQIVRLVLEGELSHDEAENMLIAELNMHPLSAFGELFAGQLIAAPSAL